MTLVSSKDDAQELSIFEVGEITCAINITQIQEINKHLEITRVHNAPEFVKGILNLRGQIITIVDLRVKFGFKSLPLNEDMRIIVVNYHGERTGLLVDKIVDVAPAREQDLEPPPSNINGVAGDFFSSIYKMEHTLAAILNVESILKMDQATV